MSTTERRARQKESLRQKILDAARQILLEEGLQQLSMRRIAQRIEYTPTTIYLYFKDKSDIIFHLCEEVYGRVAEVMQTAGTGVEDPVECLCVTMRSYIEFGFSQPDRYRIAFMTDTTSSVDPASFQKSGTMGLTAYELLRQRVTKAVEKDSRTAEEVEALAQTCWALAHGVVSLLITCPEWPWVDREMLILTSINLMKQSLHSKATGT
jgi:AcrR family transcriptional regulator